MVAKHLSSYDITVEQEYEQRALRTLRSKLIHCDDLERCDYLWLTTQVDRRTAIVLYARSSDFTYSDTGPRGHYAYGPPKDISMGNKPEVYIDYKWNLRQSLVLAQQCLEIIEGWWPGKIKYGIRASETVYSV